MVPAPFSFFQYWRLKILATLFRIPASFAVSAVPEAPSQTLIQIPSRDPGRSIKARLYSPPGDSQSASGPLKPLLVNWHGSGFIIPFFGTDHEYCLRAARENNMMVLDADYRKGPECPFPAAVHDVEDTLKWVASQPNRFDLDRIAVSGFSAGGCLALAAASVLRDQAPTLNIRTVVSIYGGVDLSRDPYSLKVPNPIRPIPPYALSVMLDSYIPDKSLRKDTRASPFHADLSLFPPAATIITCSGDTLGPRAEEFAKRLDDGKRKVTYWEVDKARHGFDKFCKEGSLEWAQREETYSIALKDVRDALAIE